MTVINPNEFERAVISEPCLTCGAFPNEPCVTTYGRNVGKPTASHMERYAIQARKNGKVFERLPDGSVRQMPPDGYVDVVDR